MQFLGFHSELFLVGLVSVVMNERGICGLDLLLYQPRESPDLPSRQSVCVSQGSCSSLLATVTLCWEALEPGKMKLMFAKCVCLCKY